MPQTPEEAPAGGAGSDFASVYVTERARTGRIVHQDTVPCLATARRHHHHQHHQSASIVTSPASAPAYCETSFITRARIKYAASLDQGGDLHYFSARPPSPPSSICELASTSSPIPVPTTTHRRRPPLQHTACFDQSDFEFTTRPLARTTTTDETPDTPSALRSDNSDLEDLDILPGDVFRSLDDTDEPSPGGAAAVIHELPETLFGDSVEASYERNYKNRTNEYFYDRAGPSSENSSTYFKIDDVYDPCFTLNDPLQNQRMSVTALFEKFCADEREASRPKPLPVRQQSESTFRTSRLKGISADRISGGFIKKTRGDRISTSSLGDQPVTAAGSCFSIFEKRKGKFGKLEKSKRLSTSALYDQSPTGNLAKTNRIRSTETFNKFHSEEFHSRFSSPGENYYPNHNVPSTSKSDNSVSKFKFYENPLERASVAKLYEKFCYDDKIKSPPILPVIDTPVSKQQSLEESKSVKTEPFSAASLSEKTSDIMSTTILARKVDQSIFNFDIDMLQRDGTSEILSPDKTERTDRSASVSNTVQLLFEDPRSNRTSISDLYEPCFSVSLAPKRPSFKREFRHWDLNTLDLRPIDDESPTYSKFTSNSSPDDILQYDTRSTNSEVFISELQSTTNETNERNGKGHLLEDINEGDSIDDERTSGKTSPCDSDHLLPKSMSSRPSMQKLEPYKPKIAPKADEDFTESPSENHDDSSVMLSEGVAKLSVKNHTDTTVGTLDKEAIIRLKKNKQKDIVALRKRTRCFPL